MNSDELQFAEKEYEKLRDEIAQLKKCQVDLLYYGLIAIGVLATVFGFRLHGPAPLAESTSLPPPAEADAIVIFVGVAVSLILPVFGWLIVHKARSAFRAIAWCKIIEGFITGNSRFAGVKYYGYETCYEVVRHHKWLHCRKSIGNPPAFLKNLRFTSAGRLRRFKNQPPMDETVTRPGRIGSYYRKLLLILGLLTTVAIVPVIAMAWSEFGAIVVLWPLFVLGSFLYLVWYCHWELVFLPFSIQSWYVMFLHATEHGVVRDGQSKKYFDFGHDG